MSYSENADKDLVRGDDRDIPLVFQEPAPNPQTPGPPIPLTGASITFTAKRERVDGSSVHADAPAIRKTSDDSLEISITDADNGKAMLHILGDDTKFLSPGVYVYDVQLRTAAGKTYTTGRGRIYLSGDVSSAEDLTP